MQWHLVCCVTNSLKRRLWQHKTKEIEGFTKRHSLDRLVHYEEFRDITRAIDREKEIKGWLRIRQLALIEASNPTWLDLSADWKLLWILRCAQNDRLC